MTAVRHIGLGPGEEFDRIRRIWDRLADHAAPSGDDCAVLHIGGVDLAVSTDFSIEGTHFRAGWLTPYEIGWRATMAALSDLAAMAARPTSVLSSLGVSPEQPAVMVEEIMAGAGEAAAVCGARVVGGDLVRADRTLLDVTVIGHLDLAPVLRRGARAGDLLVVTGRLGGPSAAVDAWTDRREPAAEWRERFARPVARVDEGRWLAERGATAMLDVSDGLGRDAAHLAAASGVRCVIDLDVVPCLTGLDDPPRQCFGGEEYELLAAVPSTERALVRDFTATFATGLTVVGRVEAGEGVSVLRSGLPITEPPGFSHF